MKLFFFILLAAIVAAQLSEDCQYVSSEYILDDVEKIEKCFDSYTVSEDLIDAILANLEKIGEVYPFTDIASNPPSDPPGYFKAMNFTSEFETLVMNLTESGGVISKVARYVESFVDGFRDGHFALRISSGPFSPNIFDSVFAVLPFECTVSVTDSGERRVFIWLNEWTEIFLPGKTFSLYSKSRDGKYVTKVNGKDAFTFFSEFFGEYNNMKSLQGRVMQSFSNLKQGFRLLDYPVEHAFDQFTLTFSDGSRLIFNLGFVNLDDSNLRSDSKAMKFEASGGINYVSLQREKEIINTLQHMDLMHRPSKRDRVENEIQCGLIGNMNYLTIPTFSPKDEKAFFYTFLDCMEDFDQNDKPITIVLKKNGGGSTSVEELVQFLLMPDSEVRTLDAFRITDTNVNILRSGFASLFVNISNDCSSFTYQDLEQILSQEEQDDLGNGVIHTRTKKMFGASRPLLRRFERFRLKRHPRKPTDIIVASDGYCFSACSLFVDNCIASGSAIVTGFGATAPGDERFVAGQCPSLVIGMDHVDPLFEDINKAYGIIAQTTFSEAFIISEKLSEKIPLDYSIMRIDKHCGYNVSLNPNISELLKHTTGVYEEFKTKCNPDNQRLLLVNDKCKASDPNALHSGYACGENGKWNSKLCKIASCKPGYIVDFKANKCVPNSCDGRVPNYPSSSSVPVQDSSQSLEAASNLRPMTATSAVSAFFIISMIKLAFMH